MSLFKDSRLHERLDYVNERLDAISKRLDELEGGTLKRKLWNPTVPGIFYRPPDAEIGLWGAIDLILDHLGVRLRAVPKPEKAVDLEKKE